jgi:transcriptional regulator with XRE-family HTH domain
MDTIQDFKIGQKIKKIRELRNLTQEHMADKLGLSQTGYGNIERDETEITVKRLHQIAHVLEIKANELLGFDEKSALQVGAMTNNHSNQAGVIYNNESFERERKLYESRIEAQQKEIDRLHDLLKQTLHK